LESKVKAIERNKIKTVVIESKNLFILSSSG